MKRVGDEIIVNPSAQNAVGRMPFINYLDTASATDNCINNIQRLTSGYPSRAQREIRVGDILISSVRPNLLHNCIVKNEIENLIASTGYIHIRLKSESQIDPNYLYYYLTSPANVEKYVNVAATAQSSYPSFNKDVIEDLPLPEVDAREQRKIGKFLSSIDRLIQLSRKRIVELEKMAKEIYDYWFVQFDFPDKNGKPYKSSGGKMVYNPQLKRSIPEGWEVKGLSNCLEFTMGQSPSGESYNDEGKGTLFYQGATDFGDHFPLPRQYTTEPSRMASAGDVLMSVRAPVGTLNRALDNCCIGRGLAAFRCDAKITSYVFYTLHYLRPFFDRKNGDGTTFGSVSKDDLNALFCLSPSASIMTRFARIVQPIDGAMICEERQIRKLTSLREFLLPLLMNGQAKMGGATHR